MKIETWFDNDHIDYIDHIELWVLELYIHLAFYPIKFWCWEFLIDTKFEPRFIARLEFPSFSFYIAERY